MYIDERLIKILETHKGEQIHVTYAIDLIKKIAKEYEAQSNAKKLQKSIQIINDMLHKAKTDSTIDVEDLKAERALAQRELNKIRRSKP
jgi:uncharacterized alpha/beta hydrolase family protein